MIFASHILADTLPDAPIPVAHDFAPALLLVLLWIIIAAAVIGPMVRYFSTGPRTTQLFTDDTPERR